MTSPRPAKGNVRVFDFRSLSMAEVLPQAEVAMEAAASEAVTILTDQEVVVKYLTPTAATRGLRCRFGPPKDDVWRIDLSPRVPRPERPEDTTEQDGGNE
ncbi:MAG: hypothetical protein O2798_10785 [Chloroflexi bacterium]|nr:hypothetical protein [Chloroflexota bacterium]